MRGVQFPARHAYKGRAFRRRNIQAVRDQFSNLNRGLSLAVLDLAQGGDRTADTFGKFPAREPAGFAFLTKPFSEHNGMFPLARGLYHFCDSEVTPQESACDV